MPKTAHAIADGGVKQLRRVAYGASLVLALVMGLFVIVVTIWGESLMQLAFGPEFSGHRATMMVISGAVFISAIGLGPSKGLWSLERPKLDLFACAAGFVTTAVAALGLIHWLGEFGAAVGWLIGNIVMTASRFAMFEHVAKNQRQRMHKQQVVKESPIESATDLVSSPLVMGVSES